MPILDVDKAKNVVIVKRGKGKGFSGVENALFFLDDTRAFHRGQEDNLHKQAGYTEATLSLSLTARSLAKWEETIYGLVLA